MNKELPYWLALAHVPKIRTKKKNEILVQLYEKNLTIIDFFHSEAGTWQNQYNLKQEEIDLFAEETKQISNYSFIVEDLLEQGYNIIPITSKDYSPSLKKNLGRSYAPPVLYSKGNLQIMKEESIAIVGSRKANEKSLEFTDNIAKMASEDHKVVVSGFAKGVDKEALESALKYNGRSIIVLPQGIETFKSGFKKYYKQIINGDVLVISTFYPKAPWSVQLAMARNPIIYGMASEIYVAESSEKGGTWSGVIDGLRKGRTIYVRKPGIKEKNANDLLISKGGKAVDIKGNSISYSITEDQPSRVSETDADKTEKKIIDLLKNGSFSAQKIVDILKIEWSTRELSNFLKNRNDIITVDGKPLEFTHKDRSVWSQGRLI